MAPSAVAERLSGDPVGATEFSSKTQLLQNVHLYTNNNI